MTIKEAINENSILRAEQFNTYGNRHEKPKCHHYEQKGNKNEDNCNTRHIQMSY